MFKLLIECSKDIDKLNIDFSDGSTVTQYAQPDQNRNKSVQINQSNSDGSKRLEPSKSSKEAFINTDVEFGSISQEVIRPPSIKMENRPIKVAAELQNMDF